MLAFPLEAFIVREASVTVPIELKTLTATLVAPRTAGSTSSVFPSLSSSTTAATIAATVTAATIAATVTAGTIMATVLSPMTPLASFAMDAEIA